MEDGNVHLVVDDADGVDVDGDGEINVVVVVVEVKSSCVNRCHWQLSFLTCLSWDVGAVAYDDSEMGGGLVEWSDDDGRMKKR